jgi:hypothetical protein
MTQVHSVTTAADSSVLLVMPLQDPVGERLLEQACLRIDRTSFEHDAISAAIPAAASSAR